MIRTRCCERLREQQNCAWRNQRRRRELDTLKRLAIANILSCRSAIKGVSSGAQLGRYPMHILHHQGRRLAAAALLCLICPCLVRAAEETALTKEQIKNFLLTAKVVKSEHANKGITNTLRLTLTDGTVTHD